MNETLARVLTLADDATSLANADMADEEEPDLSSLSSADTWRLAVLATAGARLEAAVDDAREHAVDLPMFKDAVLVARAAYEAAVRAALDGAS